MANWLSNAGLVSKGMNQAAQDQLTLQQNEQSITQNDQKLQANRMALEDATRKRTSDENLRSAMEKTSGLVPAYTAAAEHAQQTGNVDDYAKYTKAIQESEQEGTAALVNAALSGVDPRQAEAAYNQIGAKRLMAGSLEYGKDPKSGDIFVKAKKDTGEDLPPLNATQYSRMRQKMVKLGPNESIVPERGGAPVATNPVAKETERYKVIPEGSAVFDTQNPNMPIGGGVKSTDIKKDLPVLNRITEAIQQSPGMGTLDPNSGKVTPTEEGQIKSVLGNQLYLANRNLDPETIRDIAINGQPVKDTATNKFYMFYQGELYERSVPRGTQTVQPKQAEKPKPATSTPSKASTKPSSSQPTEKPMPEQPKKDPLPETRILNGKTMIKANNRLGWEEAEIKAENGRYYMKSGRGVVEVQKPKAFANGGKVTKYQSGGL